MRTASEYGWRDAGYTLCSLAVTYGGLWLIYQYHAYWVIGLGLALFILPALVFGALIVLASAGVAVGVIGR